MSDAVEGAPSPINLDPSLIRYHGVQVLRAVESDETIRTIQSYLVDTFGDSIRPFSFAYHNPYMGVMARRESARALVGTRDLREGIIGTSALVDKMRDELPWRVRRPVRSNSYKLRLRLQQLPSGTHGVIGIALTNPGLLHHRERVTDLVDDFTGEPYPWHHYVPVVEVASTRDSSLYGELHNHIFNRRRRLNRKMRLSLGELAVNRKHK